MSIQWFPGHMHLTRKKVAEGMPKVDMVIEVLDARLPYSSTNPLVEQLRAHRPTLKLLNKSDLADPKHTQQWLDHYAQQKGVAAVPLDNHKSRVIHHLLEHCQRLVPHRGTPEKPLRAMIMGVPNVGKSTLLNTLIQRKLAKVGDEPAVTKIQQRAEVSDSFWIIDTPGMLWPFIADEASGLRLAASGAVGRNAMDFEEVAWFAAEFLAQTYPQLLKDRYQLETLDEHPEQLLEAVGRRMGCVQTGGRIDWQKTAERFLHDVRTGALGRITFETPADIPEKPLPFWSNRQAERKEERREAQGKPPRRAPRRPRPPARGGKV